MKRSNCVVFGSSSKFFFAVATVIIGLEKYSSCSIDAYVIFYDKNDPIKDKDKEAAYKITKKIVFKEYNPPKKNCAAEVDILRYAKVYLAKFEIFSLLKEYKKVLWLDSDMCVQRDISSLFEYSHMAWRPCGYSLQRVVKDKAVKDFKIVSTDTYPNGGLVFVTRDIEHYETLTEECYEIMNNNSLLDKECGFRDELAIALVQKKFKLHVNLLDNTYNAQINWQVVDQENAKLVHCLGDWKFWNNALLYNLYPQWRDSYLDWEKVGGTSFPEKLAYVDVFGVRKTKARLYSSIMYNLYWNTILKKLRLSSFFSISEDTYKSFVQIYICKVEKEIHYRLTRERGILEEKSGCLISLFIEVQALENNINLESSIKKTCEVYGFSFEKTKKGISFNEKINPNNDINKKVKSFIRKTLKIVLLAKYHLAKSFFNEKIKRVLEKNK